MKAYILGMLTGVAIVNTVFPETYGTLWRIYCSLAAIGGLWVMFGQKPEAAAVKESER